MVAVAPPAGLEICVGEDGHVHIGVGEFEAAFDGGDCLCVDACSVAVATGDACACFEGNHGHKDFDIDSIALMQREKDGRVTFALPDAEPAPVVLLPAADVEAPSERAWSSVIVRERPPQWPSALRSPILRS